MTSADRIRLSHQTTSVFRHQQPFRFLDLPFDIRDAIYDYWLVSTCMIAITNLARDTSLRQTREHLGLLPNILQTNSQVHAEGIVKLYGLNTFYFDGLAAWTGHEIDGASQEICAECSYWSLWEDYNTNRRHCSIAEPVLLGWNPQIRLIRRLHISLRPYSFSQWDDVRKALDLLEDACRPTYTCAHMLFSSLPQSLSLDLLICSISKLALVDWCEVTFPARVGLLARRYVTHSDRWRRNVENDMSREIRRMVLFAQRASRTVVVPDLEKAMSLDSTLHTQLIQPPLPPIVCTTIPGYYKRSGNLSKLRTSKGISGHLRGTARRRVVEEKLGSVVEHLSHDGVALVSNYGPELIWASML